MRRICHAFRTSALALLTLLLPCSLMAGPVIVSINDTPAGNAVIQVKGDPEGWNVVPDDIDPATAESGIITLFGVDQTGLVPEYGWRFTIPNAPNPARRAVDIVWIQHDLVTGDLQVAFDSAKAGTYFGNPRPGGDLDGGVVTDNWVQLYADETLVLLFKPHTYLSRGYVPYKSSVQLQVVEQSYDPDTEITTQVLEGRGTSSHMGAVKVWAKIKIEPARLGPGGTSLISDISGVEIETAANRDTVQSMIEAVEIVSWPPPTPFVGYIVGTRTVVGGTGRFVGAYGSMTFEGVDSDGVTLEVEGEISPVVSGKK